MSNIKIHWISDEHDCETCGWSCAYGAKVYIDGKLELDLEPVAHCYDSTNYSHEKVYQHILMHLGHTIEDTMDD